MISAPVLVAHMIVSSGVKPTYTDVLVKLVAAVLRDHPRLNASWAEDAIRLNRAINMGIATAIDDGLIVPVIHEADQLSISEIARQRSDLVTRANASNLRPSDIADGTFTITNLGMYNVDAFDAVVNTPQAAILAVGRIADRVVPVAGQVVIRPMMVIRVEFTCASPSLTVLPVRMAVTRLTCSCTKGLFTFQEVSASPSFG